MPRNHRLASLALLFALCSTTACSQQPLVITKLLPLPSAPASLRMCKGQPSLPNLQATDTDLALFIQDTIEAGADCRDKLLRRNALDATSDSP